MDVGMLWFDDDPNSDFLSKVNKAADYYRSKYGEVPDMCFVHPSMLENLTVDTSTIKINTNGSMLRHHFWIGVQKKRNHPTLTRWTYGHLSKDCCFAVIL